MEGLYSDCHYSHCHFTDQAVWAYSHIFRILCALLSAGWKVWVVKLLQLLVTGRQHVAVCRGGLCLQFWRLEWCCCCRWLGIGLCCWSRDDGRSVASDSSLLCFDDVGMGATGHCNNLAGSFHVPDPGWITCTFRSMYLEAYST